MVGFAGLVPTMWALEHGVTLALANKESLVAAGDLALARAERGNGELIPVDSEHSALFQCAQLGEPESLVLTASGGPFRGRTREELRNVTPEEALAHPTWSMGPKITVDSATLANKGLEMIEAHFLFGVPYERIEVVIHPTSIVHGLVRFRDGASIAHLGYPDMRVPISYALTYPQRAATPVPPLDAADARVPRARHRDVPAARARPRGGGEGGHVSVRLQCRQRGRSPGVPRRADRLPRHRRGRRGRARARRRRARPRDLDELVEADRRARELVRRSCMSLGVAILGLAVLILVHEAGHFFVARAVGMTPRKFYLGFGPPLVKRVRGGVEYGIAAIPLGGYVKIPGMHRPAPGDCARACGGAATRARAQLDELDAALERGDEAAARGARSNELADANCRETASCRSSTWALAPDAYWRQRAWKKVVVIAAGPLDEHPLALVLFVGVFMVGQVKPHANVEPCCRDHPPRRRASRPATASSRRRSPPSRPTRSPKRINATHGTSVHDRRRRATARRVDARPAAGPARPGRLPRRLPDQAASRAAASRSRPPAGARCI